MLLYKYMEKIFNQPENKNNEVVSSNTSIEQKQKGLEEENKSLKKTLENIKNIFSIATHDVRNSMSGIIGYADLLYELIKNEDKDTAILQYAEIIKKNSYNSLHLIDEFSNWIKLEVNSNKKEFSKFNLNDEILDSLVVLSNKISEKEIRFKVKIDDGINILFNKNIIKTVVRNLVSNAVKFTNKGGEVIVRSDDINDDFVKIYVEDNGIGLNKEKIAKLFNEALDSSLGTDNEKGLGIGLYMCKNFMVKNGGNLEVESEGEGMGSRFIITIPKEVK